MASSERRSLALRRFLKKFTGHGYHSDHLYDVRAIVLAGEVSSAVFSELGEIALQVIGTNTVELISETASADVVLRVSAYFVKMAMQWKSTPSDHVSDFGAHDELRLFRISGRIIEQLLT